MHEILRDKSVIFFDMGYTIDYPASGDWLIINYPIYPDARRVLQELSQTHRLGIISDTWPSIERQMQSMDLHQFFSFTTFSFSLGVFKPDSRMYLDALEKCGRDAKETVFIDDKPENLDGAAKLGITPILIAANPESYTLFQNCCRNGAVN